MWTIAGTFNPSWGDDWELHGAGFQAPLGHNMVLGSAGGRPLLQVGRVGMVVPGDSWALNLREQNLQFPFHLGPTLFLAPS